jgi:diguanylate cyclase
MTWNYSPEIISALFLLVILIYSIRYRLVPNRRNRLFISMVSLVFALLIFSIGTVMLSTHPHLVSDPINMIIHTIFFMMYPIVPVLFFYYICTIIFESNDRLITRIMWIGYIPKLIYDVIVLLNPYNHFMFIISRTTGYVANPGEVLIFGIAIFYMLTIIVFSIRYRKVLSPQLTTVIVSYIVVYLVFLGIQYLFPSQVLSGTASVLFILILYLYIQNMEMMTDRLTNLLNRAASEQQLKLLDKHHNPTQLILISLSDFRTVNGLYGQVFGDGILKLISDYLVSITDRGSVFRYSGDTFLLILKEESNVALLKLKEIRDRFGKSFTVGETSTTIRAKFVFAQYPEHIKSSVNALAILEYLIAKIKQDPKENFIQSSSRSLEEMKRRSQVIEIIKRAVEQDLFTISIQPIYSIKDGTYTKAEALLRLTDQHLGVINPSEFIPLAEETGLIISIGKLVTKKTAMLIEKCNDLGIYLDSISVNYSVHHMSYAHLIEDITKTIEETKIFPSQLKIEITESIFISEYSQIINNIEALNKVGVGIHLDDFGTGFSNLASVVKLPLELIKFDRTLIMESFGNPKSIAMVEGLIHAFRRSGFPTLAEGVETDNQEIMVQEMGFDYIQGYHKSKPLSPSDFIDFIQKNIKK